MRNRNIDLRGTAYSMSNGIENSVSVLSRDQCGRLRFAEQEATRGRGTGQAIVDPLGSQGSVVLDDSFRNLFAVNAGDNTVSSFRVKCGCLRLARVIASGGVRPVSIASFRNLVYVVNAGNENTAANVSGFLVDREGDLTPIPGSITPLSTASPQPADAVFSPDGRRLVVSEKATNSLDVFTVQSNGLLTNRVVNPSNGSTPFGMAFTPNGILLVSEAGPNALSSYRINENNTLTVISGSVLNGQRATCWVSVTPNGRFAYTSNAGSGTISVYRVEMDGRLVYIESVRTTPRSNGAPIDNAVEPFGRYLYVLNGAEGTVSVFLIRRNGHPVLIQIFANTALPVVGAQGMAVM